jgi:predicted lipid-binding transport protein (Tim44 family)
LLATYVMLGLSLALVIWWEKHFFAKKARQNAAAATLQPAA